MCVCRLGKEQKFALFGTLEGYDEFLKETGTGPGGQGS